MWSPPADRGLTRHYRAQDTNDCTDGRMWQLSHSKDQDIVETPSRRADVFFYGLFMDPDLLRSKGLRPEGAELASVHRTPGGIHRFSRMTSCGTPATQAGRVQPCR